MFLKKILFSNTRTLYTVVKAEDQSGAGGAPQTKVQAHL